MASLGSTLKTRRLLRTRSWTCGKGIESGNLQGLGSGARGPERCGLGKHASSRSLAEIADLSSVIQHSNRGAQPRQGRNRGLELPHSIIFPEGNQSDKDGHPGPFFAESGIANVGLSFGVGSQCRWAR